MMRRLGGLAAACAAAALTSGCIVITSDDEEMDRPLFASRGADAYLIASYDAIEDGSHPFFHHVVVPMLTVDHPMTNAGTQEAPWYCFAFEDAVEADYARRRIAGMDGGRAFAERLFIEATCAAG